MSVLPGPMGITAPTEQIREEGASPEEILAYQEKGVHSGIRQREWGLQARLDPSVTFEEYTYWAKVERELEEEENRRYVSVTSGQGFLGVIKNYFTTNAYEDAKSRGALPITNSSPAYDSEKKTPKVVPENDTSISPIAPSSHMGDLDAEWRQAARALRNAGWGSVFYLITTDILGWGQTPYVFSNTGYGLGIGVFILMGLAAFVSGIMIWRVFIRLDSSRFPIVSFGDPFFRLYGSKMRHFINFMQALQMFLSVAVVQLGQTGIIAQLAGSVNLCYVVCAIISLVVGMASGYMRSLKHLGWFCNASVWINIVTFIIILAVVKNGPDPAAQVNNGILNKAWATIAGMAPVKTFSHTPPAEYQPTDTNLFAANFNGINTMVYAYSGAVMFMAFLSEMRRPLDFWKGMLLAQTFITVVYVFFGAVVYHFYGQYSYSIITQAVRPAHIQVVGNVLSLITGWLAVFLYFNVGMKTVYLEVGQAIFNLPAITTRKGRYLWWALGPLYWILALVISMSVPNFNAFTNFVGGLFSLNFSYSLSGVMYLAYKVHDGARLEGEGFDPITGQTTRHDNGFKRLKRGFFKNWHMTIPVLIFTMAGLAASGMGTWAAILALQAAFGPGGSVLTSWTCTNPFYTG